MNTLDDYILSYKDGDEIVVDLFSYYENFIRPLDDRFKPYSFYDNKLVLCWFKDHEDVNPSMGYINDRFHKGQKLYHCFGCGKTGDVIRLNQLIESQYHNRELSRKESCIDLAEKFNIDIADFDELADDDYEARYIRKLRQFDMKMKRYTVNDFSHSLLAERITGKPNLDKINSECVKMIATVKQLYD